MIFWLPVSWKPIGVEMTRTPLFPINFLAFSMASLSFGICSITSIMVTKSKGRHLFPFQYLHIWNTSEASETLSRQTWSLIICFVSKYFFCIRHKQVRPKTRPKPYICHPSPDNLGYRFVNVKLGLRTYFSRFQINIGNNPLSRIPLFPTLTTGCYWSMTSISEYCLNSCLHS